MKKNATIFLIILLILAGLLLRQPTYAKYETYYTNIPKIEGDKYYEITKDATYTK